MPARRFFDTNILIYAFFAEAALDAGCQLLFTEDLQHGRRYGALRVDNPF
jgi:predicted nucleic acid-binding protein